MMNSVLGLLSAYLCFLFISEAAPKKELESLPFSNSVIEYTQNGEQTSHPVSDTIAYHRTQRQCSMEDLSLLQGRINIALERQVEKMIQDDYIDKNPHSPGCTRYTGITMSYPIRLFIRQIVANAVTDYKQELLKPY